MEAQTAAVLVNTGVISPDEVRNKLIKNPDSGFNDIEDDLPEDDEPFNFGEEEQEGNGETPQNPFKSGSRSGATDCICEGKCKQVAKLNDSDVEIFDFTGASEDEEPKRWITTKNDVKVPVGEGENNKEACNEFFEDKKQHEKDMKNSFNAQSDMMTLLAMDYPEFKETVSGINTVYDAKYKNESVIEHHTPGFIYFANNEGFNNYKFYDKIINEDIDKDS